MSVLFPSDELFYLELIILPSVIAIASVLICEHGLFGKTKWRSMSDTTKSLSLFFPISFFLYLYFWLYIVQFPFHGVKRVSVYFNFLGLVSTILLLREFLSKKRMKFNFHVILILFVVFSAGYSGLWLQDILSAFKGIEFYVFWLSETHLLETGWTYLLGFGFLTPIFYLISMFFKDPSFFIPEENYLSNGEKRDFRSLITIGISIYSLIPLGGILVFAPIGLLLSIINLIQAKKVKNLVSLLLSFLGTVLLLWWFFG